MGVVWIMGVANNECWASCTWVVDSLYLQTLNLHSIRTERYEIFVDDLQ